MKKPFFILCTFFALSCQFSIAQLSSNSGVNLHPVSPSAFQFLKYSEMPVSEYTGIPEISIPLYNIQVDEVNIPLKLTYHSNGIKTTQEASWVGLGWDMTFGSLIQNINDRDDNGYDDVPGEGHVHNKKLLPDFFGSGGDGSPWILPHRYIFNAAGLSGLGWYTPYPNPYPNPTNPPAYEAGYAVATDDYIPIGGNFEQRQMPLFEHRWYDSEPDIFIANFLGNCVKFSSDFSNGALTVLSLNGYAVRYDPSNDLYRIFSPSGTQYFFEVKNVVKNHTESQSIDGATNTVSTEPGNFAIVSNIYYLSKIITFNQKLITFQYTSNGIFDDYPMYSDKAQDFSGGEHLTGYPNTSSAPVGSYVFANLSGDFFPTPSPFKTYSMNKEELYTLSSITFPNGKVEFETSSRVDINGDKKLDKIKLENSQGDIIKSWQLNYSYFIGSGGASGSYTYSNGSTALGSESRSFNRLKLNEIKEIGPGGGTYHFLYNASSLPSKNSFSQDYWGYSNGVVNSSLLPNPVALNIPGSVSNGNNRNANLAHAKSCILETIKYPTGGTVSFDYELNQFHYSGMLGFPAVGTISGAGLRIKTITHQDNITGQTLNTRYTYEGGILLLQKVIARTYPFVRFEIYNPPPVDRIDTRVFTIHEYSSEGGFSSDPLGTSGGVGYDVVTKENIDVNDISLGKTITHFNNRPSSHNPTISGRVMNYSIPSTKPMLNLFGTPFPENGTATIIEYKTRENKLIKKIENEYRTLISPLLYGARFHPYGRLYFVSGFYPYELSSRSQNLVSFYPIFDIESLLQHKVTTDYDENENSLLNTQEFTSYIVADLPHAKSILTSRNNLPNQITQSTTYYRYPSQDITVPINQVMVSRNKINEVTQTTKTNIKLRTDLSPQWIDYDIVNNEYVQNGDLILKSKTTNIKYPQSSNPVSTDITYNYDGFANLSQYAEKGATNCFLWDYNGLYVVADTKNAEVTDIGFTSFEGDNSGSFQYSNTNVVAVPSAPTGKKCFSLNPTNNITRSTINTKKYIVTLWADGNVLINGNMPVISRSVNGWTYSEYHVENASEVIITGNGKIDELRLYPKNAQMNTYTYEPLVGLTSECDVNNKITYYNYDDLKRLKSILDQYHNIVKMYDYHVQP